MGVEESTAVLAVDSARGVSTDTAVDTAAEDAGMRLWKERLVHIVGFHG